MNLANIMSSLSKRENIRRYPFNLRNSLSTSLPFLYSDQLYSLSTAYRRFSSPSRARSIGKDALFEALISRLAQLCGNYMNL